MQNRKCVVGRDDSARRFPIFHTQYRSTCHCEPVPRTGVAIRFPTPRARVTRAGILRQLCWLRAASMLVLTCGQNRRSCGSPPCLRPKASGGRTGGFDEARGAKNPGHQMMSGIFGDPCGNRTHITAVKGRCLNLLTNGPGSGNLTRTDDTPGMNRMLYQLSYTAICAASNGTMDYK